MQTDDIVEKELMMNRFRRLIGELMRGAVARNSFQPWEVEILVDFESCTLDRRRRMETLRQYQHAVERQLEEGPGPPMKLSEFLEARARRRQQADRQPTRVTAPSEAEDTSAQYLAKTPVE